MSTMAMSNIKPLNIMEFEAFQHLLHRVVDVWYKDAKRQASEDMPAIKAYLQNSPFTAKQTPENERAYERLMDIRMKMTEISYEIDLNHDCYMEFMQQALDKPDLMAKLVEPLSLEEKHLVHLELMIMEQVADWELESGKVEYGSEWSKDQHLVVTLPNGSTKTLSVSQQPDRRYWFNMCAVTSKIGNVKLCAGCKVVGYIGKEEQKEDWPKHKDLCKVLKKARGNKDLWTVNFNQSEMRKFMEVGLGRVLTQFESEMLTHPRVCAVTGRGDGQNDLKPCKKCECVVFRPENYDDGMKEHEADCTPLRTAAEDYKNEITLGHQVQSYKSKISKKYEPLPADINELFKDAIADLVSKKLPGYQETELRYLTFLYTCPLTVLYGLESTPLRSGHVSEAKSLTLHIVGTRIAEMRHLAGWEIIASRLPKLRQLNLVFIGDETPNLDFPKEFSYKGTDIQTERKTLDIRYFIEPPKLYQNCDFKTEPDAVIALDCGFKFYPTWRDAITKALSYDDCPLIFTEFTLEDQKDNVAMVRRAVGKGRQVELCLEPQTNPYRSLRGVRCTDKTGNYRANSVIYTNDFISVMKAN